MRKTRRPSPFKMTPEEQTDNYAKIKIPEKWGLISSLSYIYQLAENSELSELFWQTARPALDHLKKQLGFSDMQNVILAIIIEEGEAMTWHSLGATLGLTRLQMMTYSDEIDELVEKGWLLRCRVSEISGNRKAFRLVYGVIEAIRHEKPYKPRDLSNLTLKEFMEVLTSHVDRFVGDRSSELEDELDWFIRLLASNSGLEIVKLVNKIDNIYAKVLFLISLANYSLFADSDREGVGMSMIDRVFPDEMESDFLRSRLIDETHPLITQKYLDYGNAEGMVDNQVYRVHRHVKETVLSDFEPSRLRCLKGKTQDRFLHKHDDIKPKELFYNTAEENQVERLTSLLQPENFSGVQSRLKEKGLRQGFACLFYGSPGTGKTETVLQLARLTGRDIMKVEVAGLLDKWVGESEKNIKSIFKRYRQLCHNCDLQPILFFNEADAIFGTRMEKTSQSVDKMYNAIQNIILQEMEDLDGILIATTNLTGSFDPAFERRFLFKIEFNKPGLDVKTRIWQSMLGSGITSKEASVLAANYDFSGGQIENIVRKQSVDYILEGRQASLETLREYCEQEQINRHSRAAIGFRQ